MDFQTYPHDTQECGLEIESSMFWDIILGVLSKVSNNLPSSSPKQTEQVYEGLPTSQIEGVIHESERENALISQCLTYHNSKNMRGW